MARTVFLSTIILLSLIAATLVVKGIEKPEPEVVEKIVVVEKKPVKHDIEQLACLAKNIYYEARSEPIEGQIAVAIVTLNRVNHKDFPSNICDVVYEKTKRGVCQFSWVCQKRYPIRDTESFVKAVEIARLAVEGRSNIDVLSKALYYHADYVRPRWNHKTKVVKIGRHIFYEYDRV